MTRVRDPSTVRAEWWLVRLFGVVVVIVVCAWGASVWRGSGYRHLSSQEMCSVCQSHRDSEMRSLVLAGRVVDTVAVESTVTESEACRLIASARGTERHDHDWTATGTLERGPGGYYVLGCGGATYNGLAYALEDDPALAARLAARLRAGTIDRSTLVAALRYAVGHRQERGQSPEYDQVTDSLGIWFPPIVPYRIVDEPDPQK